MKLRIKSAQNNSWIDFTEEKFAMLQKAEKQQKNYQS